MKTLAFCLIEFGNPSGFLYCCGFAILEKEAKTLDDAIILYMLSPQDGADELKAIQRLDKMGAPPWMIRIMECLRMAEDYLYTEEEYKAHFPEVVEMIRSSIMEVPGMVGFICDLKLDSMQTEFASKFGDAD